MTQRNSTAQPFRFVPLPKFRTHGGERWSTSFSNAFARMVRGPYAHADAPAEMEALIREVVRDELERRS